MEHMSDNRAKDYAKYNRRNGKDPLHLCGSHSAEIKARVRFWYGHLTRDRFPEFWCQVERITGAAPAAGGAT